MIKKTLIEEIAKNTGLNKAIVKSVVEELFNTIIKSLKNKDRIEIRNFGVFYVKKTRPKKGRNLETGEEVFIPERYKVIFKLSKNIKIE